MLKLFYHSIKLTFITLLFGLAYISAACNPSNSKEELNGWEKVPEILKNIVPPVFPDSDFIITDFGAAADGKTLVTDAINKAINECSKSGGGRVIIPKGEFLTGAIHLKSNVNLHISEGAVVKFSTDPKHYLPVVHARWEGVDLMNYSPLIYAYGEENIALTGKGHLDGQANEENWWSWKGNKDSGWKKGMPSQSDSLSRPRLMKMNDENVPVEKRIFGEGTYLRPTFVEFYNCKNILIEDVTLQDSPFWFIHPVLSKNITINNVTTIGKGPNNDGCDPESCTDVLIKNCLFDTGDDCIAIKSGRNNDGRRINEASKNIIIQKCEMRDGHGGVVIGSEITGGCNNVFAEDCIMDSPNLDRAIRLKSNAKRGGVIENIFVRNIKVGQVKEAVIKMNMKYDLKEVQNEKYYPEMKNIVIENVTSNKSKYALFFDGLENSKINNIVIKDCSFNNIEKGNHLENVEELKLEDVYINGEKIH